MNPPWVRVYYSLPTLTIRRTCYSLYVTGDLIRTLRNTCTLLPQKSGRFRFVRQKSIHENISYVCTVRTGNMGKLVLLPAEVSDAAEILEGQIAAFGNPSEPFFRVLFPQTQAKEDSIKRMVDWWLGDESAKYMKVVDEETGEFESDLILYWTIFIYSCPLCK